MDKEPTGDINAEIPKEIQALPEQSPEKAAEVVGHFIDHDAAESLRNGPEPPEYPDNNAIQIEGETYTAMPMSRGREIIHLTNGQFVFLQTLLDTGNPKKAAKAAGVTEAQGWRWLQAKKLWKYHQERIKERALAMGVHADWLMSIGYKAVNGDLEMKRYQVKMWSDMVKVFCGDKLNKTLDKADEWTVVARKNKSA
jgi:hypothetical protein